jgi:hypothetical protein
VSYLFDCVKDVRQSRYAKIDREDRAGFPLARESLLKPTRGEVLSSESAADDLSKA